MKKIFISVIVFIISLSTSANSLKIGFYNLENLFDTQHDLHHQDWTYTPYSNAKKIPGCLKIKHHWYRKKCLKTDWNAAKLKKKIGLIKKMLADENLDILAVSEIENTKVLAMLAKAMGFKNFFLGVGKDKRGIHNAILYKDSVKLIKQLSHYPSDEYFSYFPTRSILQGQFKYKKETFSLFVNHWPSQYKSTFSRKLMVKFLNKITTLTNEKVIALGDFNTIKKEQHIFNDLKLVELTNNFAGTYYLKSKKKWEHLDRIFLSKNLLDGNGPLYQKNSFKIKFRQRKGKISRALSFKASDHLPLIIQLK